MRSTRRKRRLASEINVVPYIDVMLVLLVIFMITAPLLTTGVQVDLPNAQAEAMDISEDKQPIVLTVKADGELYLNIGEHEDEPLPPDQVTAVAAKALQENPDAPVVVKGDGSSNYANVVQAMVLLQQAGADKVGLLTDNIAPAENGDEDGIK